MKTHPSQVHDSMLRAVFESPDVSRAFFTAFLPPELLTYLAKAVPTMTQETLMQVGQTAGMDPELVEGSLAWRWLEEGREEGRREMARLVLRLLAKRFGPVPSWVEQRVAASSIEDLDGLSERLLEAASLNEVFG